MTTVPAVCILWDASHIWGLMAWRAVRSMGLPCRLVKAQEIAEGGLLGKRGGVTLLLVPGGSARLKALALGDAGREAVRRWVADGGNYLGFCGGAGLALTHARVNAGLGLCPWTRDSYPQRLLHLVSGHVLARIPREHPFSPAAETGDSLPPSLPVWWPGLFAPTEHAGVTVLAACDRPDTDFWLADLPLRDLPPSTLALWRARYGVDLSPDFLSGRPLAVCGTYGRGRYVLSYSHLETPHSPYANAWLALLLEQLTGLAPREQSIPLWQLRCPAAVPPQSPPPLREARDRMRTLLELAVRHHLFFARTHWLWGWRTGLPGAGCNHLYAALCVAAGLVPTPRALSWWEHIRPRFTEMEATFATDAEAYFLARRLSDTLSPTMSDIIAREELDRHRSALFGHPMHGGGLLETLLTIIEEYIYLSQDGCQDSH